MTLELTIPNRNLIENSSISKEFVDSAFSYHQEILLSQQEQRMKTYETEILSSKQLNNKTRISEIRTELESAKQKLMEDKAKITRVNNLTSNIVNCLLFSRPVQRDIILRCRQELQL